MAKKTKIERKVLKVNPVFEPLFMDNLLQPRYYQVYGGRGSGKSFIASIAAVQLTYSDFGHNIMYLRATMTTIEDSSYADVSKAIKFLGKESDFKTIKNRIINKVTGSIISSILACSAPYRSSLSVSVLRLSVLIMASLLGVVFEECLLVASSL